MSHKSDVQELNLHNQWCILVRQVQASNEIRQYLAEKMSQERKEGSPNNGNENNFEDEEEEDHLYDLDNLTSLVYRVANRNLHGFRRQIYDDSDDTDEESQSRSEMRRFFSEIYNTSYNRKQGIKYLLKPNSPCNYLIYNLFVSAFKPYIANDMREWKKWWSTDAVQQWFYTFPNNIAQSHLSIQEWQLLFDLFDRIPLKSRVSQELVPIQQQAKSTKKLRNIWFNFTYNERVKDVQRFTRLERVLYSLNVNPQSFLKMEQANNPYLASPNELVLNNIRLAKERRKHQAQQREDTNEIQGEATTSDMDIADTLLDEELNNVDENMAGNTIMKVFFTLLYFMDHHIQDRYVKLYFKYAADAFGPTFINHILLVFYMLHLGSRGHLFKYNPMAIEWIQRELAKSLLPDSF